MKGRICGELATAKLLRFLFSSTVFVLAGRASNTSEQTETILYSLVAPFTDGASPEAGLVQGSDGNFYGTTLLRRAPAGHRVSDQSQRQLHESLLVCRSASPMGPIHCGAGAGQRRQFLWDDLRRDERRRHRVSDQSQRQLHNLYSFGGSPPMGAIPCRAGAGQRRQFLRDDHSAGRHNGGTVFRISPSGSYTNLYSFGSSPTMGAIHDAGLVQGSDGNFYGTTTVRRDAITLECRHRVSDQSQRQLHELFTPLLAPPK